MQGRRTLKDWIAVIVSRLFAYVFGSFSSTAGYPRWHALVMLIPILNVVVTVIFAFSAWTIQAKGLDLELREANK